MKIENLATFVAESRSFAEIARKLGYAGVGGTPTSIKREAIKQGIDFSHFVGESNYQKRYDYSWMVKGVRYKSSVHRESFIALRGNSCERCGTSEWYGEPLTLEVHHIDRDWNNNLSENLLLLCPNCHSLTDGYKKQKEKNFKLEPALSKTERPVAYKTAECPSCGGPMRPDSKVCIKCTGEQHRKTTWPTKEQLKIELRTMTWKAISEKYGVSQTAPRRWCEKYNLPTTKWKIESYSDEEWEKL